MSSVEVRLRALLIAGMSGDDDAYHLFLKELSLFLRAFFRRRLQQLPDEVEDLVQETLLAVHNHQHTYDIGQPLTAWVHAIARYKLMDLYRRRKGRDQMHEPLDEDSEIFASTNTEAQDASRDIASLLAQLPDKQRLPIQYVKLDGLSVAEASRLTGLSESAVKIGVHRGLKVLMGKVAKP